MASRQHIFIQRKGQLPLPTAPILQQPGNKTKLTPTLLPEGRVAAETVQVLSSSREQLKRSEKRGRGDKITHREESRDGAKVVSKPEEFFRN